MLDSIFEFLAVLAAAGLGLSAGALLAEGAVLVPFWKSLQAKAFLGWYERHAALLLRFFGPLEIVPTALVASAAFAAFLIGHSSAVSLGLATGMAIAVLLAFPLYFKNANESFANGTLDTARVASELDRWGRWHWARTFIATAAFGLSLMALRQ